MQKGWHIADENIQFDKKIIQVFLYTQVEDGYFIYCICNCLPLPLPIDEDKDGSLLKKASEEHINNGNVYEMARQATFRDEYLPNGDFCMEDFSVHKRKDLFVNSPTQVIGWGSWMDAGTADAVLRRFLSFTNAQTAVIGAWDHGGNRHASPFLPPETPVSPPYPQQLAEMLHIFDNYLKEDESSLSTEPQLHYYTMGEEKWKTTSTWPPRGFKTEKWYFNTEHSLKNEQAPLEDASDEYVVDFGASTGNYNIWWEMGIFEKKTVMYPDRADQDKHLLCYTSSPMQANLEISGYPVVTLWVSSSEKDGNFIVYLEDVAPDGRVTYITEGHLRAIHRRISNEKPPYEIQVPFHTYREKDACPLVPSEMAELKFGLNPTSVLIRKGHCLRVSIAGHDKGTFARIPIEGNPLIKVQHSPGYPSCIEFPALWREENSI